MKDVFNMQDMQTAWKVLCVCVCALISFSAAGPLLFESFVTTSPPLCRSDRIGQPSHSQPFLSLSLWDDGRCFSGV